MGSSISGCVFLYSVQTYVVKEEFESARERTKIIQNELVEGADTEGREFDEHWPFQDHEEID